MTDTAVPVASAAPKPKRRRLLLFLIVAIVLLGGAGGGGFWWWRRTQLQAHAAPPPPKEPSGIVPLDPFLVNLADPDASRFLRTTLRVVVDDEEEAKEITESAVDIARARSVILEVLAAQVSSTLVTPEGKEAVKHKIAERLTAVLKREVRDVLFTDFVVQF
jgi:flagellar FliL protein